MENIAEYGHALVALLLFVLIVLVQSAMVGAGKAKAGLAPGGNPENDYSSALYRLNRSHQNGIETMAAAAVVVFASIALGVSSWWVNVLMSVFLLTRIAYIFVYAKSIGKPAQGARTFTYVAGWACLVVLCLMSIYKVFA
ncbi:MAG: MAPEG family protein [Pseudomonadota bacterium]